MSNGCGHPSAASTSSSRYKCLSFAHHLRLVVGSRGRVVHDRCMRRTLALAAWIGLWATATPAAAENNRVFVIAAGADAGFVSTSESHQSDPGIGYFGQLSWEPRPPEYTNAERGYLWRFGFVPDVGVSGTWLENGRLRSVTAGLRAQLAFSQKRMGLMQVSARGSLWLSARMGLARHQEDDYGRDVGFYPVAETSTTSYWRPRGTGKLYDFAFGAAFLLGRTGARIEYEIGGFVMDEDVFGTTMGGMRARLGLGASF